MASVKDEFDLEGEFPEDMDFDFGDTPGFGEPPKPKNAREAITQSSADFIKGGKEAFTNVDPNAVNKWLNDALPDKLKARTSELNSEWYKLEGTLDKTSKDLKSLGKETTNLLKMITPKGGKIEGWLNTIGEKLADDVKASGEDTAQRMMAGMAAELQNQFTKEATLALVNDKREADRHANLLDAVGALTTSVDTIKTFHIEVSNSYYRKSLELQYKQLFSIQEQTKVILDSNTTFKTQFAEIVKNTGLPDAVKINTQEVFQLLAKQKVSNNIQERLFGSKSGIGRIFDNIGNYINTTVNSAISNARDAVGMASMGADMFQSTREMGMSASGMAGGMVGENIRNNIATRMVKRLYKTDGGRKFVRGLDKVLNNPDATLRELEDEFNTAGEGQGIGNKAKGLGGKLLGFFNNIALGNRDTVNTTVDEFGVGREASYFNRNTQTAIVKIIPGYLSAIHAEIKTLRTGNDKYLTDTLRYDHNSDKLVSSTRLVANIRRKQRAQFNYGAKGTLEGVAKHLISACKTLTDTEKDIVTHKIFSALTRNNSKPELGFFVSPYFLNSFEDPILRTKVEEGGKRLLKISKRVPDLAGRIAYQLATLKNSVPTFDAQLQMANDFGNADLLVKAGMIGKQNGKYHTSLDKTSDYYSRNFLKYKGKFNPIENDGYVASGLGSVGVAFKDFTRNVGSSLNNLSTEKSKAFDEWVSSGKAKEDITGLKDKAKNGWTSSIKNFVKGWNKVKVSKDKAVAFAKVVHSLPPEERKKFLYNLATDIGQDAVNKIKNTSPQDVVNMSKEELNKVYGVLNSNQYTKKMLDTAGSVAKTLGLDEEVELLKGKVNNVTNKVKSGYNTINNSKTVQMGKEKLKKEADKDLEIVKEYYGDVKEKYHKGGVFGLVSSGVSAIKDKATKLLNKNNPEYVKRVLGVDELTKEVVNAKFFSSDEYKNGNVKTIQEWLGGLGVDPNLLENPNIFQRTVQSVDKKVTEVKSKAKEVIEEQIVNAITPKEEKKSEEELRAEFFASPEYKNGHVKSLQEWLIATGKIGHGISGALFGNFGNRKKNALIRATRALDRWLVKKTLGIPFKAIKFGYDVLHNRGVVGAGKMIGKGIFNFAKNSVMAPFEQFHALATGDESGNPFRWLDRKMVKGSGKAINAGLTAGNATIKSTTFMVGAGYKMLKFAKNLAFGKPELAEPTKIDPKANLSEGDRYTITAIDRMKLYLGSLLGKDKAYNDKDGDGARDGSWIAKLKEMREKKRLEREEANKAEKDVKKTTGVGGGILGFISKYKTLAIGAGIFGILGLMKSMGITMTDVVGAVKKVASGVGAILSVVKAVGEKIGSVMKFVTNPIKSTKALLGFGGETDEPYLTDENGNPQLDENGNPVPNPNYVEDSGAYNALGIAAAGAGAYFGGKWAIKKAAGGLARGAGNLAKGGASALYNKATRPNAYARAQNIEKIRKAKQGGIFSKLKGKGKFGILGGLGLGAAGMFGGGESSPADTAANAASTASDVADMKKTASGKTPNVKMNAKQAGAVKKLGGFNKLLEIAKKLYNIIVKMPAKAKAKFLFKLGGRAVPGVGQALLAWDALSLVKKVTAGLGILAAASWVFLGCNITDEDQDKDEDGNPIGGAGGAVHPKLADNDRFTYTDNLYIRAELLTDEELETPTKVGDLRYDAETERRIATKKLEKRLEKGFDPTPGLTREWLLMVSKDIDNADKHISKLYADAKKAKDSNNVVVTPLNLTKPIDKKESVDKKDPESGVNFTTPNSNQPSSSQPSLTDFSSKNSANKKDYYPIPNIKIGNDLHPEFKRRLQALAADYKQATGKDFKINSGKRSMEDQIRIWEQKTGRKYTGNKAKDVAGLSDKIRTSVAYPNPYAPHIAGLAVDINTADTEAMNKLGLLQKHGLWRPLYRAGYKGRKEPWHVEPIEARDMANGAVITARSYDNFVKQFGGTDAIHMASLGKSGQDEGDKFVTEATSPEKAQANTSVASNTPKLTPVQTPSSPLGSEAPIQLASLEASQTTSSSLPSLANWTAQTASATTQMSSTGQATAELSKNDDIRMQEIMTKQLEVQMKMAMSLDALVKVVSEGNTPSMNHNLPDPNKPKPTLQTTYNGSAVDISRKTYSA